MPQSPLLFIQGRSGWYVQGKSTGQSILNITTRLLPNLVKHPHDSHPTEPLIEYPQEELIHTPKP